MSKELEALEKLMNGCCDTCTSDICETKRNGACPNFKKYKIIETALKEYEGAKKHIEALNKERIENSIKLKALEIIKNLPQEEKQMLLNAIYTYAKSEKEYDLLYEVLL